MAYIVIAYQIATVDNEPKRIYIDPTEKYFDSLENQDCRDYIDYIIKQNMNIEVAPINILQEGELDVTELYKADALAKLTPEEKAALGISDGQAN